MLHLQSKMLIYKMFLLTKKTEIKYEQLPIFDKLILQETALCAFHVLFTFFLGGQIMTTKEKLGLNLVEGEALATIIESEIAEHGELKSQEALAAFRELQRRSEEE